MVVHDRAAYIMLYYITFRCRYNFRVAAEEVLADRVAFDRRFRCLREM